MPIRSIGFLLMRPRLYVWVIAPFLINLFVLLLLWSALGALVIEPLIGWAGETFQWLGTTILRFLQALMLMVAFVASALVCYLLFAVLASPFNDILSEKVERELLAKHPHLLGPQTPILKSVLHAIRDSLIRLAILAPLIAMALAAALVPVIGPLLATTISAFNAILFLSLDAYSYPLDRRGLLLPEKIRWLLGRPARFIPFGAGMAMLAAIPCSLLILPMLGAVAATRLYSEARIEEEAVSRQLDTSAN